MKKSIIICLAASALLVCHGASGQERKIEAGVNLAFSKRSEPADNIGAELFGGYKVGHNLWLGAGINYSNYGWRRDLQSNLESVRVVTQNYTVTRPFVYARYDILPDSRWCPFLGARLGYGIFSDSQYKSQPIHLGGKTDDDFPDYVMKYADLDVRNGIYTSIELGVSLRLGRSCKMKLALSADIQSVGFRYGFEADHSENRINYSMGPKIGFSFF